MPVNGTAVDAEEGKGYCAILSLCLLLVSQSTWINMVLFNEKEELNSSGYNFLEVSATLIKYTNRCLEALFYFQGAGGTTKPYWLCLPSPGAHLSRTITPFQPFLRLSVLEPRRQLYVVLPQPCRHPLPSPQLHLQESAVPNPGRLWPICLQGALHYVKKSDRWRISSTRNHICSLVSSTWTVWWN